jgi:hypothetical protein
MRDPIERIVTVEKHMRDLHLSQFLMQLPNFLMPVLLTPIPIHIDHKPPVSILESFRHPIQARAAYLQVFTIV